MPVSIENDPNQEEKLELVEQNQSPKNVSMEEAQKQLSTGKKSEIVQPMLPQVKHLKQKDVGRCIEDSINEPEKLMEKYVCMYIILYQSYILKPKNWSAMYVAK